MALTKATYNMLQGATVNVVDYGAIADWNGSSGTDNTSAFTAAVNALDALGGGTLLIPAGDYKGRLLLNRSNIHVSGYGATIGFGAWETLTIAAQSGTSNLAPFLGFDSGTENPNSVAAGATFYDLTGTTQGDEKITLGGTSGLSVGDWLLIISEEVPSGSTTVTNFVPNFHQLAKVTEISGTDVYLNEPMEKTISGSDAYTFAIKWDFVENIRIDGLTVNNFYGAAYCVSGGGAVNVVFNDVVFEPISAWGAVATCKHMVYHNCTIKGNGYGFSHGRMCDEMYYDKCTVSSLLSAGSTAQYFFLFSEENPKRLFVTNCYGQNAKLNFYIGSAWTNIYVADSKFDLFEANQSAMNLTTFNGGEVNVSNTTFISRGGNSAFPYDDQPNAVIGLAYSSAKITFTSCDITQFTGAVKIGFNHGTSPSFSENPYISTSRIKFPATPSLSSDANTLDDFEQGEFTPTLRGTTSDPTQSYFANYGIYQKIGDVVYYTISIYMSGSGVSAGSGNAYIDGLPFLVQTNASTSVQQKYVNAAGMSATNWTTAAPTSARTNFNAYTIALKQANSDSAISAANITNSTRIYLTGSYIPQ